MQVTRTFVVDTVGASEGLPGQTQVRAVGDNEESLWIHVDDDTGYGVGQSVTVTLDFGDVPEAAAPEPPAPAPAPAAEVVAADTVVAEPVQPPVDAGAEPVAAYPTNPGA